MKGEPLDDTAAADWLVSPISASAGALWLLLVRGIQRLTSKARR